MLMCDSHAGHPLPQCDSARHIVGQPEFGHGPIAVRKPCHWRPRFGHVSVELRSKAGCGRADVDVWPDRGQISTVIRLET